MMLTLWPEKELEQNVKTVVVHQALAQWKG